MKRATALIALVVVLAVQLFAGCTSTKIEVVRDPEFTGTIHRLYVLIDHKDIEPRYVAGFDSALSVALEQKGIQFKTRTRAVAPKKLALDPGSAVDTSDISRFGADGILIIEATRANYTDNGLLGKSLNGATYEANLFLAGSPRRIWRAEIKAGLPFGSGLRKVAREFVERLSTDGLL